MSEPFLALNSPRLSLRHCLPAAIDLVFCSGGVETFPLLTVRVLTVP